MADEVEYDIPAGVIPSDAAPSVTREEPAPAVAPVAPTPAPAAHVPDNRIPFDRFQEVVSQRRTENEARIAAETRAADLERKIQALTGLQPPAEQPDPEEAAIRLQMEKLYPGLAKLKDLPFDKILQIVDAVPALQADRDAQIQRGFDDIADSTMASLYTAAKETFGGEELNTGQKKFLHRAFVGFLESDPSLLPRYKSRDAALVSEFLTDFASVTDPIRRQAAVTSGARVARVATVPTGGSSGGPVGQPAPALPKDEDSRHDGAWKAFKAARG